MTSPRPPIRIEAVDVVEPRTDALLQWLQLVCLPGDVPTHRDGGYWWVAYGDADRPVGFAGLRQLTPDLAYLCRAGVIPAARGQGLQRRLIQTRLRKAKTLGCTTVITDTFNNPPSANSLIACGFRTYEPEGPWSFPGAIYWRKSLT